MDKNLEIKIKEAIKTIFNNVDINELSNYQKRQIIFSHLCKTLSYDFELLSKIYDNQVNKTKNKRNPKEELQSVVFNNVGICNAISQYYKLLLEQVGVKAYCVICDDGTPVNHQLTLVYDVESGFYSFDDVTSVIVKRGEREDFFDYDIEHANAKGQGNKKIMQDESFVLLPEEYINNFAIGRDSSPYESLTTLPTNISSTKTSKNTISEM